MACDRHPTILHVVHSLEGGGTERVLVDLLRAFDPMRFRHVVVTLKEAGALTSRLPAHTAVYPIGAPARSWTSGLKLAQAVRTFQAAAIHVRNTGCWNDAIVAGVLNGRARLILSFHGLETPGPFTTRQRRAARLALRLGARFTTVAEQGRRHLCRQAGLPSDRVTVLPNGVDLIRFAPAGEGARKRIRAALGFNEKSFVVGTVGSLSPVKQPHALLQAFAQLLRTVPQARLLMVGDGPLRAQLEREARRSRLDDRLRFTGWREDIPQLLAAMDAYVCCSASESLSNALLQAMACGVPIVTTDVGDHAILVENNMAGFVVNSGSPSTSERLCRRLAEALARLAQAPHLQARFGHAGRARALTHPFASTVRAYEDFYEAQTARPAGHVGVTTLHFEGPAPLLEHQQRPDAPAQIAHAVLMTRDDPLHGRPVEERR